MGLKRVVVTGLGVVTPIGIGVKEFFTSLCAGKNGIGKVTRFDVTGFRSSLAAEVKEFDIDKWVDKKLARRLDLFTHFAIAASDEAIMDAALDDFPLDENKSGVIIGSGIGGSQTIEDGYHDLTNKGPGSLSPFFISKLLINMAASMISMRHRLKGFISAPSVACSTGLCAIGNAFKIVQRGDMKLMLAGSSEACITPLPFAGFCATRSMSPNDDPESACRPFDRDRNGFIMGEGAGVVVLEDLDHAVKRGAKIYAEIVGYGNTADAYHFTAPDPRCDGMIRVMEDALSDANMSAKEVDYINAHGTSTVLNDRCECRAITKVFGSHVKRVNVSSIKSMIGHLMGAAGAVECVSTVLSVHEAIIPPTINCKNLDDECDVNVVMKNAKKLEINAAMSNSFGFGGVNSSVLIKRFVD